MKEELQIHDEPLVWTVERLHPRGLNTLLLAQFKTGKTTLALNLIKALADGELFLGHYKCALESAGRVAWWNFELDPRQARRWVRKLAISRPDRVCHLPFRGFQLPLDSPEVVEEMVSWLVERNVKVLVVDPFGAAFTGEENDNTEVKRWLAILDEIKRRAGIEDLFLIAHTGRAHAEEGREHARGATRLDNWADVRWIYTSDPAVPELRFLRAHGRDVDEPQCAVSFDTSTGRLVREDAAIASRDEAVVDRRAEEVIKLVRQNPGINQGELRRALGRGAQDAKDAAIARAVQRNGIRREKGATNAWLHYPVEPLEPTPPPVLTKSSSSSPQSAARTSAKPSASSPPPLGRRTKRTRVHRDDAERQ